LAKLKVKEVMALGDAGYQVKNTAHRFTLFACASLVLARRCRLLCRICIGFASLWHQFAALNAAL
jgi:hypothetical protein